jgi:hypothetical protein
MWSWWKRRFSSPPAIDNVRYHPQLEGLESRELPAVTLKALPPVNASQAGGNQREQSIAVNPLNPNEMVVFSNVEDIDFNGSADAGLFSAWTNDGGRTWNPQFLFTDTTLPDLACCDPQAAWDTFGNLWLTYLTQPPATDIVLALSTDSGRTFTSNILTINGENDQPALAIGPGSKPGTGAVWLTYATNTNPLTLPPTQQEVQGIIVTGKGQFSFFANGNPTLVPGSDSVFGQFGDIAVGPQGEVVVTYQSLVGPGLTTGPSTIYTNLDPDGFGPLPMGPRRVAAVTNVGGFELLPSTSNTAGIDAEVNLAWDRSNGRHRGRLYMVYTDAPDPVSADTDIIVRFSDNKGVTWSAPVRANDVAAGSQFNPAIAVDQFTGFVGVAWYDSRPNIGGTAVEFFATASDNGGRTFAPNVKASLGPSISANAEPPPITLRPLGFGDYNKIDFVKGNLQLIWADNSAQLPNNPDPNRMDLAVARVRVSSTSTRVGKKIRVFFHGSFKRISNAGALYDGTISIINLSGAPVRGPVRLQFSLPRNTMRLVSPKAVQEGSTWIITLNRGLPATQVVNLRVRIFNPLRLKIGPAFTFGTATSLA